MADVIHFTQINSNIYSLQVCKFFTSTPGTHFAPLTWMKTMEIFTSGPLLTGPPHNGLNGDGDLTDSLLPHFLGTLFNLHMLAVSGMEEKSTLFVLTHMLK